eukprot:7049944-Alexandrium_andersonii.AAC.1
MECLARAVAVVPAPEEEGGYFVFAEKQHEPGVVSQFVVYWYWQHPCLDHRRRRMGLLGWWSRRGEFLPDFEYR